MSDEVFRQTRKKITPEELGTPVPRQHLEENPLDRIHEVQRAVAQEAGKESVMPSFESSFQISGNMPDAFREALQKKGLPPESVAPNIVKRPKAATAPPRQKQQASPNMRVTGSEELEGLLRKLTDACVWEEINLPSNGKFYTDIPSVLHIRPMSGEEEQILATPRHVRRGKAIDMIFERCLREKIDPEQLVSADRTYLLIYLRGISYTPEYDVEITCPSCAFRFTHTINLDTDLSLEVCPEDFCPDQLTGTLPTSNFHYQYRLATGKDEQDIAHYREEQMREYGENTDDDTLLYRTALLLESVESVIQKPELKLLLKRLPINDVAHLRNVINDPPFGVKTLISIWCRNPNCNHNFDIDLPMEANFFFPRKKREKTQA